MKYLQTKTNKLVKLIVEWELARLILKFIVANTLLTYEIRQYAVLTLSKLPLEGGLQRLKLRCIISNQGRSILTFFKLNRMRFKILASNGLLAGVRRHTR